MERMDPETVRRLLAGQEDIITPASELDDSLRNEVPCPCCGSRGSDMEVLPPSVGENGGLAAPAFSEDRPNVQGYARCRSCDALFDPLTRVIAQQTAPVLTAVSPEDRR